MDESFPRSLRIAAGIAWRVLVLVLFLVVLGLAVARLRLVVLPFVLAVLGATVLAPPVAWLRRRLPAGLAALVVLAGALALVGGAAYLIGPPVADEIDQIDVDVSGGVDRVQEWLVDGPLDLSDTRVNDLIDRAESSLRTNAGTIASGAVAGAVVALEVVAGLLLAVVLLFFLLKDGGRIWAFLVGLFPPPRRVDVDEMGQRAWRTLGGFLRGTAIVALVDAVFIGLALWLTGVPLVLPLAVLTFFGAFIPIIGAFAAGFAAVMVALVSEGFVAALIIFGAILLVQQLEGNVLQPVVVGRSVQLHPVVVLLAVTTGGVLWGVLGAVVAVPVTASCWAAIDYLRRRPVRVDAG
jgi:predicted PurR-regulated permease PerM